jgi:putative oxidoreductase
MLSVLKLSFLPSSADLGLLLLRAVAGGSMLWLHGKDKLLKFDDKMEKFAKIIINTKVSLGLTVFAEVLCAAMIVIGLGTRFAALALSITMGVAFYKVHGMRLTGEGSGELAMLYLMAFGTIFLAGPGTFSVDEIGGVKFGGGTSSGGGGSSKRKDH